MIRIGLTASWSGSRTAIGVVRDPSSEPSPSATAKKNTATPTIQSRASAAGPADGVARPPANATLVARTIP